MKTPAGIISTRNEHLQELITGSEGDIGLADLTWIVEACVNREFPYPIYRFMSYGELTDISKPYDLDGSALSRCTRCSESCVSLWCPQTLLLMAPMESTNSITSSVNPWSGTPVSIPQSWTQRRSIRTSTKP